MRYHSSVAKRDKRLEAMRRNPRHVAFSELRSVLEDHGFIARKGAGDHWIFQHDLLVERLTVDARHHHLLVSYVTDAVKLIDKADEASGEEG